MQPTRPNRLISRVAMGIGAACLVVGCTMQPPPPPTPPPLPLPAAPAEPPAPPVVVAPTAPTPKLSLATNPRAYRQDGAAHLYAHNSQRIFPGKLPPLLYAIGVLQVEINSKGAVTALNWMRAPSHAPEVVAEIERTVRKAAPFPVPAKMGKVTYTDTWLWHQSGKFQLDTLTEGQL